MIADLHIHTTVSDGRLSPQDIVKQAEETGLSTISITDHDTVEAHRILRAYENNSKLRIIPGIEFSTDLPQHEVHILGYCIDIENQKLNDQLDLIVQDRVRRIDTMVVKLNELGYKINHARVLEIAGQATSVGRPHVAKALVEQGYFNTVTEAFETVLSNNGAAYVPHYKLLPEQVIRLVKQAGGYPVLAHPGLIGSDELVYDIIKLGIAGLEVYHPEHDIAVTNKYLSIAQKYNLKITGGSDFHGIPGRYPEKLGIFAIQADLVEYLSE